MLNCRLRGYRTLDTGIFTDTSGQSFVIGGTMFREESSEFNAGAIDPKANPDTVLQDVNAGTIVLGETLEDKILVTQRQFDPYNDDTVFYPLEIRLLQPYQGTLLRIGTVPYPTVDLDVADRSEVLSWGALDKFAPEQFRIEDSTPLGASQDETSLAIVPVSDYVFIVGDTSVFRVHRNGNVLAINEIQTLAGGVSRWATVGVGSVMFYVSPNVVYMVDGATGEFQLVTSLDRVILEDWKDSLTSIRMCYDMVLGAVFLYNQSLGEAVILWNNTGNVTQLNDLPFKWCTQGVDPVTVGFNRAWWCDDLGVFWHVNAERTSTAYSICGGDVSKDWNGTCANSPASTTTRTYLEATAAAPDSACIGWKAYFLSGDNIDLSRTITAVGFSGGEGYIDHDSLPAGCAEGDRVSIAPVYYELIGWPLSATDNSTDKFVRKHVRSMSHVPYLLTGDTTLATNPNLYVDHLLYRRGDLTTVVGTVTSKEMLEDSTKNYTYKAIAGNVLYPAWRCLASNVDYELSDGLVHVIHSKSEAESCPE
jgi:hypothetical protein